MTEVYEDLESYLHLDVKVPTRRLIFTLLQDREWKRRGKDGSDLVEERYKYRNLESAPRTIIRYKNQMCTEEKDGVKVS